MSRLAQRRQQVMAACGVRQWQEQEAHVCAGGTAGDEGTAPLYYEQRSRGGVRCGHCQRL